MLPKMDTFIVDNRSLDLCIVYRHPFIEIVGGAAGYSTLSVQNLGNDNSLYPMTLDKSFSECQDPFRHCMGVKLA